MFKLDLCGLSCPLPIIKTQKAMKDHAGEELLIITDLATARDHVKRLTSENGYNVTVEEVDGDYHIKAVPAA